MAARVLILGGTVEAADLAGRLDVLGVTAVVSLAGRTGGGTDVPGQVRVGGFGGADGMAEYLRRNGITAVVDATHPFAATVSAHARTACAETGTPRLQLRRPSWTARPGDNWIPVADLAAAAARLPGIGRRAFLTVGAQGLAAFSGCRDVWFLVRLIVAPPVLPVPGQVIAARGPFSLDEELRLLRDHRIDVLVTKASGGDATSAKLDAARQLGLPVLMVDRPPAEQGPLVTSVDEAVTWLQQRL